MRERRESRETNDLQNERMIRRAAGELPGFSFPSIFRRSQTCERPPIPGEVCDGIARASSATAGGDRPASGADQQIGLESRDQGGEDGALQVAGGGAAAEGGRCGGSAAEGHAVHLRGGRLHNVPLRRGGAALTCPPGESGRWRSRSSLRGRARRRIRAGVRARCGCPGERKQRGRPRGQELRGGRGSALWRASRGHVRLAWPAVSARTGEQLVREQLGGGVDHRGSCGSGWSPYKRSQPVERSQPVHVKATVTLELDP